MTRKPRAYRADHTVDKPAKKAKIGHGTISLAKKLIEHGA